MRPLSCILIFLGVTLFSLPATASVLSVTCAQRDQNESIDQLVDDFYIGLSDQISYVESKTIAEKIYDRGRRDKSDQLRARGLVRLAYIEFFYGHRQNDWSSKLDLSKELCGSKQTIARAEFLMFRGHIRGKWQGDLAAGCKDISQAIQISNHIRADKLTAESYLRGSELLVFQRLFGRARDFAFRSLKIAEYINNQNTVCDSLSAVIYSLSAMDRERDALAYAERLKILDPDSVMADWVLFRNNNLPNFEKTLQKRCQAVCDCNQSGLQAFRHAVLQTQLAEVRRLQRRYEEALQHVNLAHSSYERANDKSRMKQVDRLKLLIRLEMGDPELNVDRIIEIIQDPKEINRLAFSAADLAHIFEKNGRFKLALEWSKKAAIQKDVEQSRLSRRAEFEATEFWESELALRDLSPKNSSIGSDSFVPYFVYALGTTLGIGLVAIGVTWFRSAKNDRDRMEKLISARTATLEDAQRRAELADVAKSSFLARINHELRNPLTAILAYCDLLEATRTPHESESNAGTGEYLTGLRTSSRHMLELVDDVLEVSKIEDGHILSRPRNFEVKDVCGDVRNMLLENANEKGLELNVEIAPGCVNHLFGDDTMLKQILINLITNAIKFTESGFVRATVASSCTSNNRARLTVVVTDSGCGIPDKYHKSIFQPFSQAPHINSSQGKGLGLSIIQSLVEHLGGTIQLESEIGAGTRFTVCVPFQLPDSSTAVIAPPASQETPFQKVLVVDDEAVVRNVVCQQLNRIGLTANACSTMNDTLSLLDAWKPDLVMLDLRMPVNDGYKILDEILHRPKRDVVVIAMTGDATADVRHQALVAGFDGFLSKPFHIEKMKNLFQEIRSTSLQNRKFEQNTIDIQTNA